LYLEKRFWHCQRISTLKLLRRNRFLTLTINGTWGVTIAFFIVPEYFVLDRRWGRSPVDNTITSLANPPEKGG
jgi:hypothetical protein